MRFHTNNPKLIQSTPDVASFITAILSLDWAMIGLDLGKLLCDNYFKVDINLLGELHNRF